MSKHTGSDGSLTAALSLEKQFGEFRTQLEESGTLRERIRSVVLEIESTTRLMYASILLVHHSRPTPGLYCTRGCPYPDPDAEEQIEMIQCCLCEDWFHEEHLGLESSDEAGFLEYGVWSSLNLDVDRQYLTELVAEYQKLGPFMQVLPFCTRLLNQEILRASGKNGLMLNQGFSDYDRVQFGSHKPSLMPSLDSNTTPNFTGWNSLSHEESADSSKPITAAYVHQLS